jgi:hypothetical protein
MPAQTLVKNVADLSPADIDYASPFDGLADWHLLRAIAFQKPELAEPYLHLLDMEAYDES